MKEKKIRMSTHKQKETLSSMLRIVCRNEMQVTKCNLYAEMKRKKKILKPIVHNGGYNPDAESTQRGFAANYSRCLDTLNSLRVLVNSKG